MSITSKGTAGMQETCAVTELPMMQEAARFCKPVAGFAVARRQVRGYSYGAFRSGLNCGNRNTREAFQQIKDDAPDDPCRSAGACHHRGGGGAALSLRAAQLGRLRFARKKFAITRFFS